MLSYEYMKSNCGKKISWLSYIHNWFPALKLGEIIHHIVLNVAIAYCQPRLRNWDYYYIITLKSEMLPIMYK